MSRQPNILLINADQWRGDCIGSYYDNHPIMTPHINQLAAEGVTFTNAYADCPICMPQRASILTGKTASQLGCTKNFENRTPVDPTSSLPALLRNGAGYQTKAIGKMHFEPERARLGFEHVTLHPNDYIMYLEENGYVGAYRNHGLGGNELYPAVSDIPQKFYHTNWIVDQGIKFLYQRDPDNPFFLWMVFESPHSPFDPPHPYDRMYDNFDIDAPVVGEWEETQMPPDFQAKVVSQKFDEISPQVNRETRRRYYGQISNIDYQLGLLFGELKKRNLYDDTLIIFTSDHGELLGDHQLYGKTCFLRGSADIPLVVKPPKGINMDGRGKRNLTPSLTVDIFPTILHAAGLNAPEGIDGLSLFDIANGKTNRSTICGEFGDGYGTAFAFNGRFKYIYYANGGVEQLFDVETDPHEQNNRAGSKEHNDIQERLKRCVIEFLDTYNRPMVSDGKLVKIQKEVDMEVMRTKNQCALRGPLHYGQGYGGLSGG